MSVQVFGAPWLDPVVRPRSTDECEVPDTACMICREVFEPDACGLVLEMEVHVPWGRHSTWYAVHRECVYWHAHAHDFGYCRCVAPDPPTRDLALAFWRALVARWN